MADQQGNMIYIITFQHSLFVMNRQCKSGIVPIPSKGCIPQMLISRILPEVFSFCNLQHFWNSLYSICLCFSIGSFQE